MCTTERPAVWPYDQLLPSRTGLLVVLSGPSAVGKDAVLSGLKRCGLPYTRIITLTTRKPRVGEEHGADYHFVSVEEFLARKEAGQLLESADVYGELYGTPIGAVREAMGRGETVILKIDVQGAAQVKQRVPDATFIFLGPSSFDEILDRLAQRKSETAEAYQRRVSEARAELQQIPTYDYLIINRPGELECAVDHVRAIIVAERLKVHPRDVQLG